MSPYIREGVDMLGRVVLALDESNPNHHAALGHTIIHRTYIKVMFTVGEFDARAETFQRGLALLESLKEYTGIAWGQMILGQWAWGDGEFIKAKEILTSALHLVRTYGSPRDIGRALMHLTLVVREVDTFAEVSTLIEPTLKELRELGNILNLSYVLMLFGGYLVDNNHLDEGETLILESLHLSRLLKNNNPALFALTNLARLAHKRCDYERAESFIEEAYECASKLSNESMKSQALTVWGQVKLAQGHLSEAESLITEGLRVGWLMDNYYCVSHALLFLAELILVKGQPRQAVMWLIFLKHYPSVEKRDRDETIKILETARQQLSARDFTEAQEASKSLTLETIVTEILEQRVG
jgi:tetratricopeptide (TPR) repeat protein